jgi:hypothetical protein
MYSNLFNLQQKLYDREVFAASYKEAGLVKVNW